MRSPVRWLEPFRVRPFSLCPLFPVSLRSPLPCSFSFSCSLYVMPPMLHNHPALRRYPNQQPIVELAVLRCHAAQTIGAFDLSPWETRAHFESSPAPGIFRVFIRPRFARRAWIRNHPGTHCPSPFAPMLPYAKRRISSYTLSIVWSVRFEVHEFRNFLV